ncbi:MAG: T9SS type A sorting domain-containing protein [Chitinophagaceae bacterium]|nr:T9SS type A sorting domain-containing protein [Chitinophagaceae bacterium]
MKTIYFLFFSFIFLSSCYKKQNETNEAYKEYEFKIFPNPVQDVLNIQIKNDYSITVFHWKVSILNIQGISIFSETYLNQVNIKINVSTFSPGQHFLILKKGPFTFQQKINKQ